MVTDADVWDVATHRARLDAEFGTPIFKSLTELVTYLGLWHSLLPRLPGQGSTTPATSGTSGTVYRARNHPPRGNVSGAASYIMVVLLNCALGAHIAQL